MTLINSTDLETDTAFRRPITALGKYNLNETTIDTMQNFWSHDHFKMSTFGQ